MTHKEQYFETLADILAEDLMIVEGKGADYAKENDVFSNFRFSADAAGITINQVFLVLYGIKVARLENLLKPGPNAPIPRNESVLDTIGDLRRYAMIHEAYMQMKDAPERTFTYGGDPGDEQRTVEAADAAALGSALSDEEDLVDEMVDTAPANRLLKFFKLA